MKLASLEAILSALQSADVRYLIVGGLAVAAHGHGRATFDLDLVVQLLPANAARAVSALESLGYQPTAPLPAAHFADAHHRESWIRDKNMVVFQMRSDEHPETSIDLFVSEPFEFDTEYGRAMIGDLLSGLSARFVCLETLLLMKESAGRPKDQEDARQLRLLSEGRQMNDLPDKVPDQEAAWREHNLSQLLYFRKLSLRSRLEAVQGMADVIRRFEEMRLDGRFRNK